MDIEIGYQEALDYLYSFIDYSLTRSFRYSPEKFNLNRMAALLDRVGNPQRAYSVIHVAGTKGKGSVSALCASAVQAAGYQTGLYTSPHLEDFCERIQVNGQSISHAEMADIVEEIKPHVAAFPDATTFEITTALGFLYFALKGVKAAVVEVGMGGRLDSTNVVDPVVSVITSISYDHVAVLGNTLTAIAGEKGGIIKPGRPVIMAPQKDEARKVIQSLASERKSRLVQIGEDFHFSPLNHSLDGQSILVWPDSDQKRVDQWLETGNRQSLWEPLKLDLPLLGYHQAENAATAYAALSVANQEGLTISDEAIRRGFSQVVWPARFEVLRKDPPLILDSAHNRDSALKLRLALDDYLPNQPLVLLFGASEDKDIEGMFTELLPRVRKVIATQSIHPRAVDPGYLVQLAHGYGCPAQAIVPVEKALDVALDLAGQDVGLVVAGSLFIAGAVRSIWPTIKQTRSNPIQNGVKGIDNER